MEDGQFLLEVRGEEHDGAGRARGVDGGLGKREDGCGETVVHLCVAHGAPHGVREEAPHERVLVRAAGTAEDGDCAAGPHLARDRIERGGPRGGREPAVPAHERRVETVLGVHRLEVEAAAVAHPAPVDGVAVDALVADQLVAARLHHGAAAHAAGGAGALALLEVPRTCLETVGLGGERTDRADLHGVAGEVGGERLVGEGHHLGVVPALGEADERVTCDLAREARAAVAEDAALAVEEHEVADRDGLLVVALLLHESALARAVAERLVLQRALAALVTDGAVERMVREEQLDHPLLRALDLLRLCAHDLAVGHGGHARHDHHRPARALHLHHALAAHADAAHARVVAEARDVLALTVGGSDDELALARGDRAAVDRDAHGVRVHRHLGHVLGIRLGGAHCAAPAAVTGMWMRLVTRASNSSRKRVRAEWTGAKADGPTKQIVFIR